MHPVPQLCLAERTGLPSSNQCLFHVDQLDHLLFCAFAAEGGCIVVQQVRGGLWSEGHVWSVDCVWLKHRTATPRDPRRRTSSTPARAGDARSQQLVARAS